MPLTDFRQFIKCLSLSKDWMFLKILLHLRQIILGQQLFFSCVFIEMYRSRRKKFCIIIIIQRIFENNKIVVYTFSKNWHPMVVSVPIITPILTEQTLFISNITIAIINGPRTADTRADAFMADCLCLWIHCVRGGSIILFRWLTVPGVGCLVTGGIFAQSLIITKHTLLLPLPFLCSC